MQMFKVEEPTPTKNWFGRTKSFDEVLSAERRDEEEQDSAAALFERARVAGVFAKVGPVHTWYEDFGMQMLRSLLFVVDRDGGQIDDLAERENEAEKAFMGQGAQ